MAAIHKFPVLPSELIAVIDQLRALDKQRLVKLVDTIHEGDLELVVQALCQILEIA